MRILVVEDKIALAEALEAILVENKYSVDTVNDGIKGLEYSMDDVYDGIVLDIMLPGMSGLEVLQKIRSEKIYTPVLLLTAKSELEDKVKGLDYGADDYLTKPFETEELLARIRAITRRKGEMEIDNLEFSDIQLNLKTGEIICANNSVKLGLKEFQLMEMLLKAGKQIITKEQIIDKIWGYESDTEYNNVEVYISFIRKKLAHVHSKVQIKTTRGLGYSLEARCEKN